MADDDIEVGEDIEITELVDEDGDVVGTVVDDVVVVTREPRSTVAATLDVIAADGHPAAEAEIVDVYDADGNLIAEAGTEIIEG
ncbi:MAG: hypothetical protein VW239_09380 [Candidatus Nanopelagicales bacterium]